MSVPSIPQDYSFHFPDGLNLWLDDVEVRIKEIPSIKLDTAISSIPKITTDSKVDLTLGKVDLGLDNIHIKELPRIEMKLGIEPTRVHLPSHYQICFSILGMEMFKFALCGETMLINEPFVPHETERCP